MPGDFLTAIFGIVLVRQVDLVDFEAIMLGIKDKLYKMKGRLL